MRKEEGGRRGGVWEVEDQGRGRVVKGGDLGVQVLGGLGSLLFNSSAKLVF